MPVTVLGGRYDAITRAHLLEGWRDCVTGPLAIHLFPGGHFFVHEAEAAVLGSGFDAVDGGPDLTAAGWRESVPPAQVRGLTGRFVAEVGVGTVHRFDPRPLVTHQPRPEGYGRTLDLNRRLKLQFDPNGRMNPGRRMVL